MSLGRTVAIGRNGARIPVVGLGTWQSDKGLVRKAVDVAIRGGYRHIDCAYVYSNVAEVGDGIKDAGVPRSELFITSKLWNSFHTPDRVESVLDEDLKALGTDYLDLYLMHWPVAFAKGKTAGGKPNLDETLTRDHMPTWRAMEALVRSGKVKEIGISNFTIGRAEALMKAATIKPAVNQVELNLRCAQPELLAWAKANDIVLQAYSPLGSTGAPSLDDVVVQQVAKAHSVDPANVLIAWSVQRGCVCLPKSVTPSRVIANFQDVILTDEEMVRLEARANSLDQVRTVDPSDAWGHDIFNELPSKQNKL